MVLPAGEVRKSIIKMDGSDDAGFAPHLWKAELDQIVYECHLLELEIAHEKAFYGPRTKDFEQKCRRKEYLRVRIAHLRTRLHRLNHP